MTDHRVEMYRPIHKAIRHLLYTTVQQLAFTDFNDPESALPALKKMNLTMDMMRDMRTVSFIPYWKPRYLESRPLTPKTTRKSRSCLLEFEI